MSIHSEAGEEGLEFPLRGRIGEVSDVKTTTFSSCGEDCLILGSVDGLPTGDIVCSFWCMWSNGGGGHILGDVVNGRHIEIESLK